MTKRMLVALLIVVVCLQARGQQIHEAQARGNFAITVRQVVQTLSEKGIRVTDQQVSLLANVVAIEPNPALEIVTVSPLEQRSSPLQSTNRSIIRLACHLPGTCLPFYAIVSWPQGVTKGVADTPDSYTAASILFGPKAPITMRAGTLARLVMDDERSHIQVAVISLESGAVGRRIRVTSTDHKQIYVGEVVSANVLKRSY
jgi:hypothetical protein